MNKLKVVTVRDLIQDQLVYRNNIEQPLVSIIMPCSTKRNGITKRAIDSILTQSFTNFELILVDDGSIDGLEDELYEYYEKDSRVVYIRNHINCGVPALRLNQGIFESRGAYISYMFEDDILLPGAIADLYNTICNQTDLCLVYGNTTYIDEHYTQQNRDNYNFCLGNQQYEHNDFLDQNRIAHCSVIHHKEIFNTIGYYDPHILAISVSDWDLWRRISKKFRLIACFRNVALATLNCEYSLGVYTFLKISETWNYLENDRNNLMKISNIYDYNILSTTYQNYTQQYLLKHPNIIKNYLWKNYFCHINNDNGIIVKTIYDTGLDSTICNYKEYIPQTFFMNEAVFFNFGIYFPVDFVILSRATSSKIATYLLEEKEKSNNVYSIYLLDDDFFNLGQDYLKNEYPEFVEGTVTYTSMTECMKNSDGILSYSDSVQKLCKNINEYTWRFSTAILDSYISTQNFNTPGDTITIAMASNSFRTRELKILFEQLKKLATEYSNRIKFIFIGAFIDELKNFPCEVLFFDFERNYDKYITKLKNSNINIFISPLLDDHIAKRGKTPIKFLESVACGAIPVLSDMCVYSEMSHGINAYLIKDTEWYSTLKEIILSDPNALNKIYDNAKNLILNKFTTSQKSFLLLNSLNLSKIKKYRQINEKSQIKVAYFFDDKCKSENVLNLIQTALILKGYNFKPTFVFPKSEISIDLPLLREINIETHYLHYNIINNYNSSINIESTVISDLESFLLTNNISLAHINSNSPEIIIASKNIGVPVIADLSRINICLKEEVHMPLPDSVLFDNHKAAKVWSQLFRKEYIKVLPAIDETFFRINKSSTINKCQLKIILYGDVFPDNNQLLALESLALLKKNNIPVSIDFIGCCKIDANYYNLCENYRCDNQLMNISNFHGAESNNNFFESSDILLNISNIDRVSIAMLQAFASETMVISSSHDTIKELIKNGFNGFLLHITDSQHIYHKIIEVFSLKNEMINEIRKNAKKTALYTCSREVFEHNILETYKKAVESNANLNKLNIKNYIKSEVIKTESISIAEVTLNRVEEKYPAHIKIENKLKSYIKNVYYFINNRRKIKNFFEQNILLLESHITTEIYNHLEKTNKRLIDIRKINAPFVETFNGQQQFIYIFLSTQSNYLGKLLIEIKNENNIIIESIFVYNCDCDFSRPIKLMLNKAVNYSGKVYIRIFSFGNISQLFTLAIKDKKLMIPFIFTQQERLQLN